MTHILEREREEVRVCVRGGGGEEKLSYCNKDKRSQRRGRNRVNNSFDIGSRVGYMVRCAG